MAVLRAPADSDGSMSPSVKTLIKIPSSFASCTSFHSSVCSKFVENETWNYASSCLNASVGIPGVCVATRAWLIPPPWDDGRPVDDGDFSPRLTRVQSSPKLMSAKKMRELKWQQHKSDKWYDIIPASWGRSSLGSYWLSVRCLSLSPISIFPWSHDQQRNKQETTPAVTASLWGYLHTISPCPIFQTPLD